MTLRVLNILPDLQVGGVQTMILRHAIGLKAYGVQSDVCCLHKERGPLWDEFEKNGFRVFNTPFASRLDPCGLWKLRSLVRREKYPIVQPHMYAACIATNVATLGLRNVVRVNIYHSIRPGYGRGQTRRIRLTRNLPDAFVVVSGAVRDAVAGCGIPNQNLRVIYNGIPVPDVPHPLLERPSATPLQLLWGGRFVPQKRVPFLVDVADCCRRAGLNFHLTLRGDGGMFPRIQRSLQERNLTDWVSVPGVSDRMSEDLRECDLFLLASEREGFPVTILEAAAQGRGMILSDIPPHREFLGDSGAGLIPGDDPQRWCDVLLDLDRNRQRIQQMGLEAFRRVQAFSLPVICRQYNDLYRELLQNKGIEIAS